jgi:UDP-N-acetylglucosamine acyltransferase
VPPFIKVAREPLQYCGINVVALQRHSFTKEQCSIIEDSYRLIYQSKLLLTSALEAIEQDIPDTAEKEIILSFIRNSSNGIVKKIISNG